MLSRKRGAPSSSSEVADHPPAASTDADPAKWQLIDPVTGEQIGETDGDIADSGTPVEAAGLLYDWKSESREPHASALPTTVIGGLMIAIAGHSFWNATSMLVPMGATALGASEIASLLVSLGWTVSLIAGLLMLGSWILREVRLLPDTME